MESLISLAIMVAMLVGVYKTFSKMGYEDAWMALIPFANLVFFCKVLDKPIWWAILFFIPFVNIYCAWLICVKVSTAYGKEIGFTVGLLLLGFIFFPILGFGSDQPQKSA